MGDDRDLLRRIARGDERAFARNKLRESLQRGRVEDAARRALGVPPIALEDDALQRVEERAAAGGPAFLSCATTVFYIGRTRLRVAMLVDAFDHTRQAAPLPENFQLSARREGPGWLVVFGDTGKQREQLLSVLRVNAP